MKNAFVCLLLLVFVSCKKTFTSTDLALLNGNWEIEKVEMPNGKISEYGINPSGESISFANGKGTKTKIMLQLVGPSKPTDMVTQFVVLDSNNVTYIKSRLAQSQWIEELTELTSEKLVVKNQQNIIYQYKRIIEESNNGKTK